MRRYTTVLFSAFAFGLSMVSLNTVEAGDLNHALGKALFDRLWTSAPASTDATDGLGPLFNARSCATCHPQGSRGQFGEGDQGHITGTGLVIRFGNGEGAPDPTYGVQLQTLAVQGLHAEGHMVRKPNGGVVAEGLTYGELDPATRMSGRLAPDLHGLGALQQISESEILAWADEDDADGDGISGRANYAYNAAGERVLSRYGWKAGKATVQTQSAAAMNGDIGLSNPVYPRHFGDCTDIQSDCMNAPHGGSPRFENLEIDSKMLRLIVSFVTNFAPRTGVVDTDGAKLFEQIGCAACHRPLFEGGTKPYTDLLLHDMGDDLADGIGDERATGREWRTAPLWGLSNVSRFLHDGRAKSIHEAIAFHGGEAVAARTAFEVLPAQDRERLLTFLSNL